MKIKTIDGTEIDTDTLNDVNAMAVEKLNELGTQLKDYGLSFLIFVDLPDKRSYANKYIEPTKGTAFVHNLNSALLGLTDGRLCLAIIKPKDEE